MDMTCGEENPPHLIRNKEDKDRKLYSIYNNTVADQYETDLYSSIVTGYRSLCSMLLVWFCGFIYMFGLSSKVHLFSTTEMGKFEA